MNEDLRGCLERVRMDTIELVIALDRALGYERTMPSKDDRQIIRQVRKKYGDIPLVRVLEKLGISLNNQ